MRKLPTPYAHFSTATIIHHRGKNTPKKPRRRNSKELVDARRGCIFETPPYVFSLQLPFAFGCFCIFFCRCS